MWTSLPVAAALKPSVLHSAFSYVRRAYNHERAQSLTWLSTSSWVRPTLARPSSHLALSGGLSASVQLPDPRRRRGGCASSSARLLLSLPIALCSILLCAMSAECDESCAHKRGQACLREEGLHFPGLMNLLLCSVGRWAPDQLRTRTPTSSQRMSQVANRVTATSAWRSRLRQPLSSASLSFRPGGRFQGGEDRSGPPAEERTLPSTMSVCS